MTTELKPIVKKVLASGLVDRHEAELLEKWGAIPGASELVNDQALKNATTEQLIRLTEDIATEIDKEQKVSLKETQLDLDQLKWPTKVTIVRDESDVVAYEVPAVIDRMGRLYFRYQDIDENWFVPGRLACRNVINKQTGGLLMLKETILEKSVLYSGATPICLQVTVER